MTYHPLTTAKFLRHLIDCSAKVSQSRSIIYNLYKIHSLLFRQVFVFKRLIYVVTHRPKKIISIINVFTG